jgi:phenylacetic acid degradation operon negative regulatory protein
MGIKERRTKILLSMILFSDVDFGPVTMNSTYQHILDLTFNEKTRGTLSGLVREAFIEKVDEKENQYKLTDKGFYELCLKFPFFRFLKLSWDGKWRILSYEIPEKKRELRDRLRREVSGWGLGPWHRSFWLTPHPIIENLRQLVSQKEEEQYVQAFEADHIFGDKNTLIEKVWQKTILDRNYREAFKQWHEILSQEGEKTDKFKKVINKYIELLKVDPGLPKDLVGNNWIGFEAFHIYKEIRGILLF